MSAVGVAEIAPPTPREGMPTMTATIRRIVRETADTSTYWLSIAEPSRRDTYRFAPGQFNMVYLFGVGEVPISISSDPRRPLRLAHTIRSTGRVTNVFAQLAAGDRVGLRGPFGRPWPVEEAAGGDLLIVAGGLGLAPVRPAIYWALHHRERFGRVIVLVGARSPEHMLFRRELDAWGQWMRGRAVEVGLTVDLADDAWPYGQGVVTTLFDRAEIDPGRTTALVCGPEIMMRFAARGLLDLWLPPSKLYMSMERNMQCAVRLCGHCQLGPKFVCADGPVFRYDEIGDLLEVQEL
jgi:NAD(P)H-flavin reductase